MGKKYFVAVMFAFFVFGLATSAVFAENALETAAKAKVAQIQKLQDAGNWPAVVTYSRNFVEWARYNGGHFLDAYTLPVYDTLAAAREKEGLYDYSANIIREKHSWKPDPANVEKVMTYEKKGIEQADFFQKSLAFQSDRITVGNDILKLTEQRATLVNALLAKASISQADLTALQGALASLSTQIDAKKSDLAAKKDTYLKAIDQYQKDGVIFTAEQNHVLSVRSQAAGSIQTKIDSVEKTVQDGVLKINQKFQFSWPGLEDLLSNMKDLQTKIMALQQQMLAIMAKNPLSADDKKNLLALKSQLDQYMIAHNKVMADIVKAFMTTSIFSKLSQDQQTKYIDIFRVILDAQNVINSDNKIIADFISKMDTQAAFGDLNGDGKVDQGDLPLMIKYVLAGNVTDKVADLNGNGKVDWNDYMLLREMVNGTRKTAPVDPANIAGDLNGNGAVDEGDLDWMIKMYFNPDLYAGTAFKKIADINGDGKFDIQDIITIVNQINRVTPVSAAAPATGTDTTTGVAASGTVVEDNSGQATGATNNASTGTGTSAGSLRQGF
ncbi:MAG: hypothetical protein HQM08_01705 [Candidatus Riflebacteria bacterium]|nr:hypothetical protein [Candidatus Riflebacteria bacterium]